MFWWFTSVCWCTNANHYLFCWFTKSAHLWRHKPSPVRPKFQVNVVADACWRSLPKISSSSSKQASYLPLTVSAKTYDQATDLRDVGQSVDLTRGESAPHSPYGFGLGILYAAICCRKVVSDLQVMHLIIREHCDDAKNGTTVVRAHAIYTVYGWLCCYSAGSVLRSRADGIKFSASFSGTRKKAETGLRTQLELSSDQRVFVALLIITM